MMSNNNTDYKDYKERKDTVFEKIPIIHIIRVKNIIEAWRVGHERMFILVLALLVGFFAAVAAFTLHWIINQIVLLLTSSFDRTHANWLYLVYPLYRQG